MNPTNYNNPTAVNAGNPKFGTSDQFNIAPFLKPYDFQQDKGETGDYLNRMQAFIPQSRGRIDQQFGLPLLREQFLRGNEITDDLQSQILQAPKTVAATSRESLLTEGQRAKQVQSMQDPMYENLSKLQAQQGQLGNRLNLYEGLAESRHQEEMLPFEREYNSMEQRQARQFSGYTFANQLELNRLVENQKSGLTWTNSEAERANKLALQEMQYKMHLDGIKEQGSQQRQTQNTPVARTNALAQLWSSFK